jgi:glutamate-1-semialdehyde 2,1-aminomutase
MAAAEATLTEVLTGDAYEARGDQRGPQEALPGGDRQVRPPGLCRRPRREGLRDLRAGADLQYRDYLTKVDGELSTLAWLYHMNHGIFMTPGVEEEWTLSIAHEQEHIDRYMAAFEAFASDVSGA